MTNKTQIILVQYRVENNTGADIFQYRIAKLIGDVKVSSFSFRNPARVGDVIDEAHAEALASVRDYTVTVTQQQETR